MNEEMTDEEWANVSYNGNIFIFTSSLILAGCTVFETEYLPFILCGWSGIWVCSMIVYWIVYSFKDMINKSIKSITLGATPSVTMEIIIFSMIIFTCYIGNNFVSAIMWSILFVESLLRSLIIHFIIRNKKEKED